jgi:CRISPR system Cascade subunit CasD
MGVRVDQEGQLAMDYHTTQDVYKAAGGIKKTEVSRRYYLADAIFLVGLEGDLDLLEQLQLALQNPHWFLYLGRKAHVPSKPVWLEDGLCPQQTLMEALEQYEWLGNGEKPERLRIVLDDPAGAHVRPDVPISFEDRRFTSRRVKIDFISLPVTLKEEI